MAAAVVLPPAHHDRMQVHSFTGDQAHLLDKLIAASQRKEVPVESLKERPLVPFFDSMDTTSSVTSFQALQPARRASPAKPIAAGKQHGLKRHAHERSSTHLSGSPPKKEAEVLQAKHQRRNTKGAASAASSATSSGGKGAAVASNGSRDVEATSARKPRGGKKHQQESAGARGATSGGALQHQSPLRKRPEHATMDMATLAAASAAAASALRTPGKPSKPTAAAAPTKFAGPAFTNSPTPDCLPLPTSSLLQEAADGLRSRLTL